MGEQGAKGAPISQDCLSYAHHGMCSSTFLHMNIHIQEYAHTASKLTDPPPHTHPEEGEGRECVDMAETWQHTPVATKL